MPYPPSSEASAVNLTMIVAQSKVPTLIPTQIT